MVLVVQNLPLRSTHTLKHSTHEAHEAHMQEAHSRKERSHTGGEGGRGGGGGRGSDPLLALLFQEMEERVAREGSAALAGRTPQAPRKPSCPAPLRTPRGGGGGRPAGDGGGPAAPGWAGGGRGTKPKVRRPGAVEGEGARLSRQGAPGELAAKDAEIQGLRAKLSAAEQAIVQLMRLAESSAATRSQPAVNRSSMY